MANSFFQFKQFTIQQDRCTMKVATDSCILGAWFANRLGKKKSLLDIGSGTGLLMLMLAQKNQIPMDGIELDSMAYEQLSQNLDASPWKNRLRPFFGDIRNFSFSRKYDFIISNPPFFENDLRSPSPSKNQTRHEATLSLSELLKAIDCHLEPGGEFGILIPYSRMDHFLGLCKSLDYFLIGQLLVRQTPRHGYFRAVLHFSKTEDPDPHKDDLVIEESPGKYADAFVQLLKDYYLYL